MKKYYKYVLFVVLFFLVGCGFNSSVRSAVNDFFMKYTSLDETIMDQLNSYVKSEDLTDEQEEVYKEVIKRQYRNLEYEIVNEEVIDDETIVHVKIWVYDLYKAQKDALDYYNSNMDEFKDSDGYYDKDKYVDFKLNKMKDIDDKKEYELDLKVVKDGNKYRVKQLTNDELEKIHGIYNYEE